MSDVPQGVQRLADMLNRVPTVSVILTTGRSRDVLVFFQIKDLRWLYPIGRALDRNYGGYGLTCELNTSDRQDRPVGFCISSYIPVPSLLGPRLSGEDAYKAASDAADRLAFLLGPEAAHIRKHFNLPEVSHE